MDLVWLCDCGWRTEETGDGRGMAAMGSHLAAFKRKGEPHTCVGLVDESGAIHVKGLNPTTAVDGGYIRTKAEREAAGEIPAMAEPPTPPQSTNGDRRSVRTPKDTKPAAIPTNIQGLVQGWKLPLVGSLWGIYSMAVRMGVGRPRRHGAARYVFTQEGMAYFIQDVVEQWFIDNAPAVLGLTPRSLAQPDQRQRLDRFISGVLGLTMEQLETLAADEDVS